MRKRQIQSEQRLLRAMARKYVWWLSPAEAAARRDLAITQVMELGDYDDVLSLEAVLGRARLAQALRRAEAGKFSERSWVYWHYRLGLTLPHQKVPPLPRRALS